MSTTPTTTVVVLDVRSLAYVILGLTDIDPDLGHLETAITLAAWSQLLGYDPEAAGHDRPAATAHVRAIAQAVVDGTATVTLKDTP